MNTKALWITVGSLAILIFAGNHYLVRSEDCDRPDEPCKCRVRMVGSSKWGSTVPTCSVKFSFEPDFTARDLTPCDTVEPGVFDRVITCDPASKAVLHCGDGQVISVGAGSTVRLECRSVPGYQDHIVANGQDPWQRAPVAGGSSSRANRQRAAEIFREGAFITATARVRVIEGDAGMERASSDQSQMLVVASGQAELESFCTGDLVRLSGPGTLKLVDPYLLASLTAVFSGADPPSRLPDCKALDVTGRWRGAYTRRLEDKSLQAVRFILDIRSPAGGTLQTPDGTFDLSEYRLDESSLSLRAIRKLDNGSQEVVLNGQVTKGGMVLDSEDTDSTLSAPGKSKGPPARRGKGFAEKLHIAQSALPTAVLNQPYSHRLLALSPARGEIAFRLAQGSLPGGITLDQKTGTLSGTPAALGDFSIVVAVTDANGDLSEQPLTLTVKKLAVTTRLLPDGFAGQRYAVTLKAAGGRPPYRWAEGLIPLRFLGFELNPETGELTGTPAEKTEIPVLVKVTDADGNTEAQAAMLTVRGVTILTSQFLPEATVGVPYKTRFQAAGNSSPVTWEMRPPLDDAGLQFNPQTGELSGTPAKAGEIFLQVTARHRSDEHSRQFLLIARESAPSAAVSKDNLLSRPCPPCSDDRGKNAAGSPQIFP